jgi:hypothetical protein
MDGEMNMSSIDNSHKDNLKTVMRNWHRAEIENKTEDDSYFIKKSNLRLYESVMFDYHFDTPGELRQLLHNMWSFQGHHNVNEIVAQSVISAFSNSNESEDIKIKQEISAFIYNF